MSEAFLLILWLIPLLPACAGLLVPTLPARHGALGSTAAAFGALALALAATAWRWPWMEVTTVTGPGLLVLRWDLPAAVMVLLVTFIGMVVMRFSRRYLDGDPGQGRFYGWLNLTLASVLLVMMSGHLLLLWAAWVATSLCLHQLLLFYPGRPAARFAARKKFVISRIGDVALLAAAGLLYRDYGTLELTALYAQVAASDGQGLGLVTGLLALCAMCKSAQLPFHTWLPDTMDTPTPVSAFMHAGIINAGGFLLIRVMPLLVQVPVVMNGLALIGALTAGLGAVVMLTQPSIKRALAYSTVAQMGFMILQCGLGAPGLALIHIVAHSIYKAHAFLNAGSTVGAAPRAAIPLRQSAIVYGSAGSALLVAGGMTALHVTQGNVAAPFALITGFAAAYGLIRFGSLTAGWRGWGQGLLVALGVVGLSLLLHAGAERLIPATNYVPSGLVLIAITTLFAGLFVFQLMLWRAGENPLARRVYVHALNGFYLGTLANRALGRLWPSNPPTVQS
ncbi:MAG: hypothetical protein H7A44_11320 [Opitutaceae bacterium]|nr:hypothetical protein [Opitutaceae bacterium]